MAQTHRFGRRIPLPPTVQILHELLAMSAREGVKRTAMSDDKLEALATKINAVDAPELAVSVGPEAAAPGSIVPTS